MLLDNKSAASPDLAADAEMLRVMPDPHLVRKTLRRQRGVFILKVYSFATFCQTAMPIRTAFKVPQNKSINGAAWHQGSGAGVAG
jgi:hypothetical protein